MNKLFKKLTLMVKDGFTGTVPLLSEDTSHEEKMKNESDAHKADLARNKMLLQNQKYGSRRKQETWIDGWTVDSDLNFILLYE